MDAVERIRENLTAFASAAPRERRSFAKAAAHHAALAERAGIDLSADDLALMIKALDLGAAHHGWPGGWRAAKLRLMKRARLANGGSEPVIRAEMRGVLDCTGGFIVAHGAGALDERFFAPGTADYRAARAAGAFFDLSTGGDGRFRVTVRVLESGDPDVSMAELPRVAETSPAGLVQAEGGMLRVWAGGETTVALAVPDAPLLGLWVRMKGSGTPAILFIAAPAEGRCPAYAEAAFTI